MNAEKSLKRWAVVCGCVTRPDCGAKPCIASVCTGGKSGLMPMPSPFLLIAALPKHDIQALRLVVLTLAPRYSFVTPRGILSIYSDCLSCQQICTLLMAFRCCDAQKCVHQHVPGRHPAHPKSVTRSITCNKIVGYAESKPDSFNFMNGNETNPT